MANFHHLCCGLLIFGSCSFVPVDSTVSELPVPSAEETATNLSTRALDTPPLGAYQLPISGATEEAQRWFNQGLLYLYGFNHDAAAACFSRAATLSPDSAMTWWGMAHALNLDINQFEISEQESAYAVSAIRKAEQLALSRQLTDLERILIQAESARTVHPAPPLHERGPLDKAYSKILENAWSKHPGEADLGCLFAESLMILQPWAYWTPDKEPVKRALDIVHTLESVIALDSQHPGANHFYIHAMESSATPEKAEAAADRLGNLAPRAGHLVHMPSHIYINVGRYEDAVNVNVQAAELDKAYLKEYSENTFYHNYYVHNLHFVAYAAMMEGRKSLALE
ncbi:MAG: hypothetical protein MK213_04925, partial [Planctomycetes bacterium]|nr:hypothetical protein [Planctomycetota bacterium]